MKPNGRLHRTEKRCLACAEPIHRRAIKCKVCGSYQDKRRHINFSSSVLALLVALASVLTFLIPIVADLWTPEDSNIKIQYQGSQQNRAFFLATNSGNRPGSVVSVAMILSLEVDKITDERIASRFDVAPLVVAPGAVRAFSVSLEGQPRKLIDQITYESWENNVAKEPKALPRIEFWISVRDFAGSKLNRFKVTPFPNNLLLSGPTKFHRCAGSIAWSDWNGPTSHFFPADIDPEAVTIFCGEVPKSFKPIKRDPMNDPRPDAAWDVFE